MSGIKWLSGNLAELDGVKFKWEAGIAYCDYGEDGVFENEGCGTITYEEWVKMINDDAKSTHEHCPSYPNCEFDLQGCDYRPDVDCEYVGHK